MKNNLGKLQIFSITNEDATKKKRIDVEYYQPFFKDIVAKVAGSKFELQKLEDVTLLISNGRTPSKDMYDEDNDQVGSVPIIKAGTASGRFVDLERLEYAKADFSSGKKAQKGDIFVLSAAHQASYVGKNVSILDVEPEQDTYFVGELICVRANPKKVLPEYLFGFLSSEVGYLLLNREKRGQTSHIYPEDVKTIPLPIPSLKNQQKIVAILGKAYEEKKQKEAEIKMILAKIDSFVLGELGIEIEREREREEIAFAITSDEIEGRIDPFFYKPSFKTLQRAIESKHYSELGELVEFAKETWDQKSVFDNQFPYIEIGNIDTSNGEIAKTDFMPVTEAPSRAKMVVREGDIIVSTTRPNRGAITPISKEQDGFIASTGFAILRDLKNSKVLKDYLFVALRTSLSLRQMEQRTTGGNYPAITTEDLRKIKIVVPEIKTQEKIAVGVKIIYEKAKRLRQEVESTVVEAQKQVEQMILA